jgi:hypothetical protein
MTSVNVQGWTLDVSVDEIDVTSSMPWWEPDPAWAYTDTHGHTHRWQTEQRGGEHHAVGDQSWHAVLDDPDGGDYYFDSDGEEYNAPTHCECRTCGDTLEPGRIDHGPDMFRRFIPGLKHYTLTDPEGTPVAVSEDETQLIVGLMRTKDVSLERTAARIHAAASARDFGNTPGRTD